MNLRVPAAAIVVVFGLTAVGLPNDSTPSRRKVDQAAKDLDTALQAYLLIDISGPASDPATWVTFFNQGAQELADVKKKLDRWVRLSRKRFAAGDKPKQGEGRVRAYQNALRVWLVDQREQFRLSKECFYNSGSFADTPAARACYVQAEITNGERWQADTARVQRLLQALGG